MINPGMVSGMYAGNSYFMPDDDDVTPKPETWDVFDIDNNKLGSVEWDDFNMFPFPWRQLNNLPLAQKVVKAYPGIAYVKTYSKDVYELAYDGMTFFTVRRASAFKTKKTIADECPKCKVPGKFVRTALMCPRCNKMLGGF